ncbi:hypothetical protein OG458_40740 [Streptomyces sp. NBC_01281]|uniref:hypothetical protein n=1 Tax=unclassified Streptomyces TaxID=2593676 RepID=UPI0013B5DCE3|nr:MULTISPECIES: hypothetical protein [unclassified Streptomyces]NEB29874.1 hypothetical protein [Streptomyces sp. SID14446]WSK65728.1 hypothetical protein OG458_40740 [Streptomyces sp. NBC_01281]
MQRVPLKARFDVDRARNRTGGLAAPLQHLVQRPKVLAQWLEGVPAHGVANR